MALPVLTPPSPVCVYTPDEAVALAQRLMPDEVQEWSVLLVQDDDWQVQSVLVLHRGRCHGTTFSVPEILDALAQTPPLKVWLLRSHNHRWDGFSWLGLQRFRHFRLACAQAGLTVHDVCVIDSTRQIVSLRAWGQAPASVGGRGNGSGDAARISPLSRIADKTIFAASCSHVILSAF